MNLGDILVAVTKENGWDNVGMLELAVGDPELQVLTLSGQDQTWGGWGLTFPSYVKDYLLPNLTGSCGDTAPWLQRMTSATGENTPFVLGDIASVVSGVSGAGTPHTSDAAADRTASSSRSCLMECVSTRAFTVHPRP